MIKIRMNDIFNPFSGDGIFSYLARLPSISLPWDVEPTALDLQYHGNHSGLKLVSPLVRGMMNNNRLTETNKTVLAQTIFSIYGRSWVKLWNAMTADYNPISNYDMTEKYTENGNNTETGETGTIITHGETVTNAGTVTNTGTVTTNEEVTHGETIGTTGENVQNIFGFNSSSEVPTDTATGSQNETHGGKDNTDTTETRNLSTGNNTTETHGGTDKTDGTSEMKTVHDITHELARSGNIGVTTSQQMIESEIELRKKNFFDSVFADIDRVLTIATY